MSHNKDKEMCIQVELGPEEQDFLQRLGLASLLNSKYGPSIKMLWARLVENRVPIFFGGFLITSIVAVGALLRADSLSYHLNVFRAQNAALKQKVADCPCESGMCNGKKIVVEFYKPERNLDPLALDRLADTITGELDPKTRIGELEVSILHTAIHLEVSYPTLKKLIEVGADPNAQINSTDRAGFVRRDQKGNSVVVSLIRKGRWECAIDLINDFDIDLEQKNYLGKTPHKIVQTIIQTRSNNTNPTLLKLAEVTNPDTPVVNND